MSSSTKPVASFADTLREQDEIFYTVFPQALSGTHSFDFASIQDDDKPQFQQSHKARAPQLLFPQPSPSQSWFGGHLDPHHFSGSWTFPTHSALYGNAKSSNSPSSSYTTTTAGTSQHSGNPPKSRFSTEIKTDPVDSQMTVPNQHISKGSPIHQDKQLHEGDKRPSRSKSSKHNGDRKPILACFFCRGRKIACGPPATETGEKTCRQCQRRSLTCVYPSGSRRGMRKKKDGLNLPNS